MFSDFFIIFYWWLVIFILGAIFLPLSLSLFQKFWDRGWIFSKIIAIVSTSYLIFLLSVLHILPFLRETIFLCLLVFLSVVAWWFSKKGNKGRFFREVKSRWKVFLFEELIFFIALIFWSFIRGFQPDIEGLEKFMDFGFVNSILRSGWFPPADMWFAGESINYYYFGHLQAAVLTRISGLSSSVTYNLMMATVFAFTFSATFSLVSNLVSSNEKLRANLKNLILAGIISAFLISLGGNLHATFYVLKDGAKRYWYPDATRFIGHNPNNPNDKTIHEFPVYSFVVSDLHGHMNNIPTVLLFLAILLVFIIKSSEKKKLLSPLALKKEMLFLGILLGMMYMTNSWDYPIYGTIFALVALTLNLWQFSFSKEKFKSAIAKWLRIFQRFFSQGVAVLFVSILATLPFAVHFKPMAEGIAFVRAHSPFWQLLILWGFFWFITLGLVIFVIGNLIRKSKMLSMVDLFIFSSTVWATILIIVPEVIYVKDIYIPEYHRANTMFKLVYQSFMIYSVAAGYVFLRLKNYLVEKFPWVMRFYVLLFLIGFSAHMIYPYFAIRGYYGNLTNYRGLEGLGFMKNRYPENFEAISWIEKNIMGQPVMLEAVGDSYTDFNQISAVSGLPTIEGWLVHEWLWRGGYDRPGARASEVEAIYGGEDENQAKKLLKDYNVKYVFVGPLEKKKYSSLKEERLNNWGKVVFSSGEAKIYELDRL